MTVTVRWAFKKIKKIKKDGKVHPPAPEIFFITVSFLMCSSNLFVKISSDGDRNVSPGSLCY